MTKDEKARAALERCKKQLERVQTAWWEPADVEEAVTWAFYAYENAIVAVAEAYGIPWQKNHSAKAQLAESLASKGILATDVSERLRTLNELRKDVSYGDPGPELQEVDAEDVAHGLETFVEEVEAAIASRVETEDDDE